MRRGALGQGHPTLHVPRARVGVFVALALPRRHTHDGTPSGSRSGMTLTKGRTLDATLTGAKCLLHWELRPIGHTGHSGHSSFSSREK